MASVAVANEPDTLLAQPLGAELISDIVEIMTTTEGSSDQTGSRHQQAAAAPQQKKARNDDGRHFKFGRKRTHSFNNTTGGKFGPSHKRWKRDFIVPPTKFLLGGNICDPLNLNSLQDEETNRAMNAVTPHSSPLPTPRHRKEAIEVLIPPNIKDPLNLADDNPDYELRLISPKKKKPRNRRRKTVGDGDNAGVAEGQTVVENIDEVLQEGTTAPEVTKSKLTPEIKIKQPPEAKSRLRRSLDDKIVSPVIPQPGAWKNPPPTFHRNLSREGPREGIRNRRTRHSGKNHQAKTQFKANDSKFQYGNYNRYYGYRNPDLTTDSRLESLPKEMFEGKSVLDIGCNVGHVTLEIARNFKAKSVVGIDIDKKLLQAAKNNVKHYASVRPESCSTKFPACMPSLYGTLDIPLAVDNNFPNNVSFIHGNYVLESEVLIEMEKPQFHVITCLSVTKWFHLNFGDEGLKRAFKRMFAQLHPGGRLVLEPQPWSSYKTKKKLTETIFGNFKNIRFYPHKFTEYLLGPEVGFSKCDVIGTPQNKSRGFMRPVVVYLKAESANSSKPISHQHDSQSATQIPESEPSDNYTPLITEIAQHSSNDTVMP